MLLDAAPGRAQAPIIGDGDAVVTGFSGTVLPEEGVLPGVDPLDETVIDLDGASLRIFDVSRLGGAPEGQLAAAPKYEVTAREIGQVFGLALVPAEDAQRATSVPDIYAAASSMFGLHITALDAAEDGQTKRLRNGSAEAQFMAGQWGDGLGGGPGSIWKIDGVTGEVSLFADVVLDGRENSGPGLGDLAFDVRSHNLYVSDLDTGLIHRFDLSGTDLGHFDHGRDGRTKKGLQPVADDGRRLDIRSQAFVSEHPSTWGFTQPDRRVHGLTVHQGRIYYAVAEGPQIWSVGLEPDGRFKADVRWELDVGDDPSFPIADVLFDSKGRMYLAQRGTLQNPYDYSEFAEPSGARVQRFAKESPDDPATSSAWKSAAEEYAVGFPDGHRQGTGGIALQYGYGLDGNIDDGACEATILATGDLLRDNPQLAIALISGGPASVHGVQITGLDRVRPANVPPWQSYFVDYDGSFAAPEERGHIGDVEVHRVCEARARPPSDTLPPGAPPPDGKLPPPAPPPDGKLPPHPPPGKVPPPPPGKEPPPPPGDQPPGTGQAEPKPCADPKQQKPDGTCCPDGRQWNLKTNSCEPEQCPPSQRKPDGSCCPPGLAWNSKTKACGPPKGLPCLDPARLKPDGTCCPFGQNWDPASQSCEDRCPDERKKDNGLCCPEGTTWDASTKTCGKPEEPNIKVEKRSTATSCKREDSCSFEIVVSNTGPSAYSGPIALDETTIPAVASFGAVNAPWTCQSMPGAARCSHPPVALAPGQSVTLNFECTPGAGWTSDQIINCAAYNYSASGKNPFGTPIDDKACVTLPVCKPGEESCCPPDIRVEKSAKAAFCSRDEGCTFEVVVTNAGLGPYSGPIVLDEKTSPGAAELGKGTVSAPWSCLKYASGYRCSHPAIALSPQQSVTLSLNFVPGSAWSGTTLRNCATFNFAASGKLPSGSTLDDESCAEVPLAEAQQIPAPPPPGACTGGMVLNEAGRCICPAGTSWNGRRCADKPATTPPPRTEEKPKPKVCPDKARRKPDGSCCPKGREWDGRRCARKRPSTCPRGTKGRPPNCKPIKPRPPKPAVPAVPKQCPPGTTGTPPNCKLIIEIVPKPKVPKQCPPGTTGKPPNCKPAIQFVPIPIVPKCPPGTTGVPPNCAPSIR